MRVAVLSSTPASATEGSGTFVALDGLSRGLVRLGHHVAVVPLRVRTGFHTFDRWIYNAWAASRPPTADLVIGVDLDGFLWARRRRHPRFVVALKGIIADELRHEQGWVRVLLGLQARWEQANCARADRVVVPSRYSAEVAAQAYGLAPARVSVVPEPIDLEEWDRRFAEAGRQPAGRPTVLAVARAYPRKRLADLLEAAALLRGRIPGLEIRIVGQGPESARLRVRHAELQLEGSVTLLGEVSRSRLAVEYMRAWCFCLPTVQEGFGLVFAEAMAAGLPVVACRAAAVPELVIEGRTGLLVEPRAPRDLAAALERMLVDGDLRRELGSEGRHRVEGLAPDLVARRFLDAVPA